MNDHWRSPKTLRRMAAVVVLLGFAAATFAAGGRLGYAKTYAFPTLDEGKDDDVPAQAYMERVAEGSTTLASPMVKSRDNL